MSWKLSVGCSRAQAEAAGEIDGAVLVATELNEAAGHWRLDVYIEDEPDRAMIAQVTALGASAPSVERLADQDWVRLSQAGLEPIREGRFVVHTAAHPIDPPAGGRAFRIEAGQAFGTGHHETTAGCLAMLDAMADRDFGNIIDLGTGTGLLAFAAQHLWPSATIVATDIDPIAIAVTRENMAANQVTSMTLVVADGARDPAIETMAPFDLIIANILAGPLIAMAAEIAAIARPGATLVMAGLLSRQVDEVAAAYATVGCFLEEAVERGQWSILRLTAGATASSAPLTAGDRIAWSTDGA